MKPPNQNRNFRITTTVEDQLTVIHINTTITLTAEATESLAKALKGECKLDCPGLVDLLRGLTENDTSPLLQLADKLVLAASIIRSRREIT